MLAIKLTGVLLIFSCGILWGIKKARDVIKRAEIFRLMSLFLDDIYASVRYRQDNAVHMLISLAKDVKFKALCLQFEEGDTPQWPSIRQMAIDKSHNELKSLVKDNEFEIFSQAISTVGQDVAQRENEKLEFYKEKLIALYKIAKEDAAQKQKLYTGVGFFVGACAGIILL